MRLNNYREKLLSKTNPSRIPAIAKIMLCMAFLTLAGWGFNSTYAIFNTYAKTPTGTAGTANADNILKAEGSFDPVRWLATGESGLNITNNSSGTLWVYFTVQGDIKEAIQHIDAVRLTPGETYQVPVRVAKVDELGLLGWSNNEKQFSGQITARVLNNFCSYEIGSIEIKGVDLYLRLLGAGTDGEGDELKKVKQLRDVTQLIIQNKDLTIERDRLLLDKEQMEYDKRQLQLANDRLNADIQQMGGQIDFFSKRIDYITQESGIKTESPEVREQSGDKTPADPSLSETTSAPAETDIDQP